VEKAEGKNDNDEGEGYTWMVRGQWSVVTQEDGDK